MTSVDARKCSRHVGFLAFDFQSLTLPAFTEFRCPRPIGVKYDFAMLICECERNRLPWQRMEEWLFVDTLHILDAIPTDLGGCKKLQCVSRFCSGCDHGMAAHRALSDTIVLRAVVEHISECLSVSLEELVRHFCYRLHVDMSARYLNALGV